MTLSPLTRALIGYLTLATLSLPSHSEAHWRRCLAFLMATVQHSLVQDTGRWFGAIGIPHSVVPKFKMRPSLSQPELPAGMERGPDGLPLHTPEKYFQLQLGGQWIESLNGMSLPDFFQSVRAP